jgi:hypothetical protein
MTAKERRLQLDTHIYILQRYLMYIYMLAYLFRNQMIDRQKEMVLPITDDRLK